MKARIHPQESENAFVNPRISSVFLFLLPLRSCLLMVFFRYVWDSPKLILTEPKTFTSLYTHYFFFIEVEHGLPILQPYYIASS